MSDGCEGDPTFLVVNVLPHTAQRHQVERPLVLHPGETGKPVVQPCDFIGAMQRHSRVAKRANRFNGNHIMSLPSEPRGVSSRSGSEVSYFCRGFRQEIEDRSIKFIGIKCIVSFDQ